MKTTSTNRKSATNRGKKRITFYCKADPGSEVYLAGDFNGWDPYARRMTDKEKKGIFTTTMMLHPGTYEYKFVVNGYWSVDYECGEWVPNGKGSLNSLLYV
jgi:1,4-alpha-glucan branching enzyme